MLGRSTFRFATAVVAVALLTATAHADTISHDGTTINMDFVTIGNPGNANDTHGDGYGAVNYSYNIGKYAVTKNQWDAVSGASALLDVPGRGTDDQPVTEISWHEAAMFCNWLTSGDATDGAYTIDGTGVVTAIDRAGAVSSHGTVYVIPTENEWYKAAYYDGGASTYYDYPTGSDTAPDGFDTSTDTDFDAVFDDGYNQSQPNDVDNAGVLSPYGTMGQGGNVWEWNETTIDLSRGLRGGSWGSPSDSLTASARNYNYPAVDISDTGFRVASVPEPGGVTLLLGGLLGLLTWRRRRS